ncbi:MAG: nuclear transport factor 2 family protein [Actinobacteria bacterium]|nr:nuclear transport factor 2 family protein [Actinomycetota bacterium]MCB9389496.1 nuclear transport factor 2 family protein [Acidimicrobiia bacterium]
MNEDQVEANLEGMDNLDFKGWNAADWEGVFAHYHTDDVVVDFHGQPVTHGIEEHIDAMKAHVGDGSPTQIALHPIKFGSGEWTCVVGEFANGDRMVTVARWRDGAICEEYIWGG